MKTEEKDLTIKQRKFLKLYIQYGNGTKAAYEVYDCKDYFTAANIASENLKKLHNPLKALMESKGISLGKLTDKVNEGLDSTRTTNASILITSKGKIEKAEEQGLIEVPDYQTRHKYIETAAKWLGVEDDDKTNVVINNYNQFAEQQKEKYGE